MGTLYLDLLLFSYEVIDECSNFNPLSIHDLNLLLSPTQKNHNLTKHPKAKPILAENLLDNSLNKVYPTLYSQARDLKADRATLRSYLTGQTLGLFRGACKFSYIKNPPPKFKMDS